MGIDRARSRQCLNAFDFRKLFIEELGWDKFTRSLEKQVDGRDYRFQAVAQKRGVVLLVSESIPEYAVRVKVDKLIAKEHFEHLIVFTDQAHGRQVWQWVRKEPGKPTAVRTYHYTVGQSGELLLQKLDNLAFTLEEEEVLTLGDVTGRLRTLDVEKVTKRFYERFKAEHSGFLGFINGIPDKQMEGWYASVMINRLMFLYFIQEKEFLNGDKDYLRNKLAESGDRKRDAYYSDFLSPLFFQGFARKTTERSASTNKLLGNIPYLNGGLFQKHQIEELHGRTIVIPDKAFEKLFDFFKEYNWHLDERENRNDREINPDVLGYIFEKYINQKQMGAYYTKEDITEYISQNTIIPFLLDEARKGCAVAFAKDGSVWRLLRDDPDRYIHDAMKKGANWEEHPLPEEIAAGIDDVSKRTGWNRPAPEEFALPTEIWREAIDRHQRYRAVKAKLARGEAHEVNDLVTLNLNIRQFAQDVVQFSEGPDLLRSIWKAIEKVSVLDPTCGSGAFLFAALNILKPLYEACLIRMQGFIEDNDALRPKTSEEKIHDLIKLGESSSLEFKSTARWNVKEGKKDKAIEQVIVKTVAAFLNSQGGDLLIGVKDDGSIFGIEEDQGIWEQDLRNRDSYENWLTGLLLGACGKQHAANLHISFARLNDKDVCRVTVLPSAFAVYVKVENLETLYVRAGNSTHALPVKEAVAYHQQRFTNYHQPPIAPEKSQTSKKYADFRKVFEESTRHPKQDYFILKAIIVNNLFGVDIMEEAVEICKLRLFLKLVAQVESQDRIEPLPDIDFNIRAGNTLVGYARYEDVEKAVGSKLDFGDAMSRIQDKALTLDQAVEVFRQQQTQLDGTVTAHDKAEVRGRLSELETELNDYLSGEYGVKQAGVKQWRESHKPFHWFCDFHSILTLGGFDVIIGNPPYVEESASKLGSPLKNLMTAPCGDLYAYVFERVINIAQLDGRIGLIVPISIFGTDGFISLQNLIVDRMQRCWEESFANRPSQLFSGAQKRLTIALGQRGAGPAVFHTGGYLRWGSEERGSLFSSRIKFATRSTTRDVFPASIEKLSSAEEISMFEKLLGSPLTLEAGVVKELTHPIYYTRKFGYFLAFLDFVPSVVEIKTGKKILPSELKALGFRSQESALAAVASLSSTTFFWFWNILSDCRNLNRRDLLAFPVNVEGLPKTTRQRLAGLGATYLEQLNRSSKTMTKSGLKLQTFDYSACKSIIDSIDDVLAQYCGFTEAECDFVKNYDIKYRLHATDDEE